ncbi:MAG: sensor histidine kinase [Candidatus Geothermincolia bacterium]
MDEQESDRPQDRSDHVSERSEETALGDKHLLERYMRVLDNSPDIIYYLDNLGRVVWVNPTGAELLGYRDLEGAVGQPFTAYIHPDDREQVMNSFIEAVQTHRDTTSGLTFRLITGEHVLTWVELHSHMLFDENGVYKDEVGACRDVTARKLAEEELSRANEELKLYARVVSHDLKGPLSAIKLGCEVLRKYLCLEHTEQTRDSIIDLADLLDRNVDRSIHLISDLLALAEVGRAPSDITDVDIATVVRTVLDEHSAAIETRGVRLLIDDDLGVVTANEIHVYQVFSNLISNAIKFNDNPEPILQVSCLGPTSEGYCGYRVRDNGSGISEEHLDAIFDPFFKGDTGDTGIGLSIVKKIIRTGGGDIRAFNDKGACFDFTFLYALRAPG